MVGQQVSHMVVIRLTRDPLTREGDGNVTPGLQGEITAHVVPSDLLEQIRELR